MTRAGPNQDINDPLTLRNLLSKTSITSVLAKTRLDELNDTPFTGAQAIPISLELKLANGQSVIANTANPPESYWGQTVINTYIDQPERFRQYWKDLNIYGLANLIPDDIETAYDFDIGLLDCVNTHINVYEPYPDYSSWPVFQTRIQHIKNCEFPMSINISGMSISGVGYDVLSEPVWTGVGPTSYNYLTFPQLQDAFNSLEERFQIVSPPVVASFEDDVIFLYTENSTYIILDNAAPQHRHTILVNQRLRSAGNLDIFNLTEEDITVTQTVTLTVIPGSPVVGHNASKTIAVGNNSIHKSTDDGDTQAEVDALGGIFTDSKTYAIPAKTLRTLNMTIFFEAIASSQWYLPGDLRPPNSLNPFLCGLTLQMTVESETDSITIIPSVNI